MSVISHETDGRRAPPTNLPPRTSSLENGLVLHHLAQQQFRSTTTAGTTTRAGFLILHLPRTAIGLEQRISPVHRHMEPDSVQLRR